MSSSLCGKATHTGGVVGSALHAHQTRTVVTAHQTNGFTRRTHAHFDLGTDGHQMDDGAQGFCDKGIVLVTTVVTNVFAKQAPGDSDADFNICWRLRHLMTHSSLGADFT